MSSSTPYDLELIEGCRRGKRKYQERLYKAYYSYGMSIALRYAHSSDEAKEVLNDSFMKIFKSISKYNPERSFKGWVRRIIINTSIDYYRKNLKFEGALDIVDNEPLDYNIDGIQKLNIDDIISLLRGLPEVYRVTFNLYEIEGYNHDEIADLLNIEVSTSRSNLTRAKQKLRVLFHKHFGES